MGSEVYRASHGELCVSRTSDNNCSLCICLDGEASLCQSVPGCSVFSTGTRDCELDGEVLGHGQRVQV